MNSERIKECTELATDILKNFELSELPVSKIILKCLRLCRLLGDEDGILLFTYESSGYPSTPAGLPKESWRIAGIAGRRHVERQTIQGKETEAEYAETRLIAEIEENIVVQKLRLSASTDPNISISSANPAQVVIPPSGNQQERRNVTISVASDQRRLQQITGKLYSYVLNIYNKLVYGNIMEDVFTQYRMRVNDELAQICPDAIGKFVSVYNNMDSENPEDWANAVHSCRRILVDIANTLYPPREQPIIVKGKEIKLGLEQYINRLIQYISNRQGSQTYKEVVGTDLRSIGERLDAINSAVCKGTHVEVGKDEASRYIIHTYLLVSDIISLHDTAQMK